MVTSQQAQKKYGTPAKDNKCMTLWDVPFELEIGVIPRKIYTNVDMVEPLKKAFGNLIRVGTGNAKMECIFNLLKSSLLQYIYDFCKIFRHFIIFSIVVK